MERPVELTDSTNRFPLNRPHAELSDTPFNVLLTSRLTTYLNSQVKAYLTFIIFQEIEPSKDLALAIVFHQYSLIFKNSILKTNRRKGAPLLNIYVAAGIPVVQGFKKKYYWVPWLKQKHEIILMHS